MGPRLKAALSALDRRLEECVCGICLCLMAGCVMLQVVLRYAFSAAAPWAEEIAVYSMIGAIYFGASLAVRERAHIRVAFIYDLMPPRVRLATIVLADTLWLLFLFLVLSQSVIFVKLLFETVHVSPGLGIEQRWPQSIVPASIVLMAARILQVYWRWYRDGAKGAPL